jgi:hypothetical protein
MFDTKQFVIKKESVAVARWTGEKDDLTLSQLLALFRREKWRGQFQINYPGNGGVQSVVFTEKPSAMKGDELETEAL